MRKTMLVLVGLVGCRSAEPSTAAPVIATSASMVAPAEPAPPPPPVRAVYPWAPTATDRLDVRFAAPSGFGRVTVEEGSFGDFLRTLPLLPPDAPVVDFQGNVLHAHHPSIAAVVDLDIGKRDLQQCADAVLRLDAEWRYGRGRRDMSYRSVSGARLVYARWLAGDREAMEDGKLVAKRVAAPSPDTHAVFRAWTEDVEAWASTASLEREGEHVELARIRPGDFFVMSGSPFGHAVLVLDVARDDAGRVALLLGQSYMPAQSFHVLRASPSNAWFVLDADATEIATPFWRPFPMSTLRRMP